MTNQILSRKQVKELLNISYPTLNKLNRTQELPAYKIGRKVFYKMSDIEKSLISLGNNSLTNKQEL
jgi:excisionase family DNA binding protein